MNSPTAAKSRAIRWCLGVLLIFAAWAACAQTAPSSSAPLEIYVENNADPYSKPDGTGYANDVVKAAFDAVGVKIVFNVAPYARGKNLVLSGAAAVCVSMSWDPSFEGLVKFADTPLITITPVYFENSERSIAARDESQLGAGLVIGSVRDYEYPAATMRVKDLGAVFEEGPTEQANLKKLAAGRIDLAVVMSNDLTGVNHWVTDAGVGGKVRVAFSSTESENGYLGVSLKHPQGLWALAKYNEGVKIITANGTLKKIHAKWSTP